MSATETAEPTYDASEALAAPTLCHAFQITARERGDAVALRYADDSVSITWAEYATRVRKLAEGFASLGVERGGAVALLLANRPEVNLADTAAIHLGAAAFSIYFTNPAEEIVPLLENSGAKVIVTETQYLDRVLKTRELHPDLEHIVVIDGPGGDLTFAELEERTVEGFDFEAGYADLEPESVVTLVYTSGTTGQPKGVQHTHLSLLYGLRGLEELDHVTPGGAVVSYLPMAHIAERWISHYASMVWGHTITSCPDAKQLAGALASARPTRLFGVPRIFEKLAAAVHGIAAQNPAVKDALDAGLKRIRAEQEAGTSHHRDNEQGMTEEQLQVLAGIRAKMGLDRLEWTCVAAAPSSVQTHETFHALGIPLLQIWGMSECIFTTITPPTAIKLGTVGTAVPGVEVKLADDGEILVKGPNLMSGYRNEAQKTKETYTPDGWLLSGDIAREDELGFLTVYDRKKELIINSSGKNMSPQRIEMAVKEECGLIGQCVAIGDARIYVTALVSLDPEACAAAGYEGDADALRAHPEVAQQVADGIARANDRLARVEQIKTHTILPVAWVPGSDEVTPTMKLKRRNITTKYAAEIDAMYAGV